MNQPAHLNRLTTFVPPRPSLPLVRFLVPVNRVLGLGGIPGLRRMPILNWLPVVRGLADIEHIDFPALAVERLRNAITADTAAFIVPNHPEFLTDWLLDKELSARAAPLMASWATHDIVNGLGSFMQCFWLKNNLIAQIPGEGGAAGKAYSVEWALRGHGVLLHPEGQVGWHADTIGPLFPGVVEMALEALLRTRATRVRREVCISPVIWRMRFLIDVDERLAREMTYVERKLGLTARAGATVAQRVHDAYSELLQRDEAALGMSGIAGDYGHRQNSVLRHVAGSMTELLAALGTEVAAAVPADPSDACRILLRPADRLLRAPSQASPSEREELRRVVKIARRLLRFRPSLYPYPELTQEQVAENIKRLRADYCFGSLRDTLGRFAPRPVGPRRASIRVAQPIRLNDLVATGEESSEQVRADLLALLHARMQEALDDLGRQLQDTAVALPYANPFAAPLR
jgi:hypothetical protein